MRKLLGALALAVFMLQGLAVGATTDEETEPNDSIMQAADMAVGRAMHGSLSGLDDVFDWYCIDFAGAMVMRGRLVPAPGASGPPPRFRIGVYSINLARQAVKILETEAGGDGCVTFIAPIKAAGRYYIRVSSGARRATQSGDYILTVEPPFDAPQPVQAPRQTPAPQEVQTPQQVPVPTPQQVQTPQQVPVPTAQQVPAPEPTPAPCQVPAPHDVPAPAAIPGG